jgi:hypothetical protein
VAGRSWIGLEIDILCNRYNFDRWSYDSREKPSVGEALEKTLLVRGAAAAGSQYREMKEKHAADYNFSIGQLTLVAIRLLQAPALPGRARNLEARRRGRARGCDDPGQAGRDVCGPWRPPAGGRVLPQGPRAFSRQPRSDRDALTAREGSGQVRGGFFQRPPGGASTIPCSGAPAAISEAAS